MTDRDDAGCDVCAALDAALDAWARVDAASFGACFTDDATYTTWFGVVYRGPAEIADAHRALWAGPLRGTRLDTEVEEVRFLTDDVAVLATRGDVVRGTAARRPATKTQTWVAVREADRWRFAVFVNVRRRRALSAFTAWTVRRSAAGGGDGGGRPAGGGRPPRSRASRP